ncbi:glycosyltransferase [Algoriphagus chordae]|uniref:Glycosyltransferase involved in cell wall biosynthesis n=1 Tax=Algoriphagus chordae TaxID=237019 RepID=A0A2W7QPT2_9BACT|nr:glycosyltransferase [Algoriphagus chordae]PZX50513.1 glycosyltransferase involved in cell wall biosynthesis [Algoriphagus chordae]
MAKSEAEPIALISVIITCYNHGKFLAKAIESVLSQSYAHHEIIVVDDGSTDDTKLVCQRYKNTRYVFQENAGLSSARNTGIKNSNGSLLVFLDADDWLLQDALQINYNYLKLNTGAAFSSGGHELYYEPDDKSWPMQEVVKNQHYIKLLEKNYIGMHATVMYRRWVFDTFNFNTSLTLCEDYELYLRIARQYPVHHHTNLLAVYRLHQSNASAEYGKMLSSVLGVLTSQKKNLASLEEKDSFQKGMENWQNFYSQKIYDSLIEKLYQGNDSLPKEDLRLLKKHNRSLFDKLTIQPLYIAKNGSSLNYKLKRLNQKLHTLISMKTPFSFNRTPNSSILGQTEPISKQFGYDRGGPIDRYYIENFLEKHASKIRGHVLEIGDNDYTIRFGGENVSKSDVLHIEEGNEKATIVGDLTHAPQLTDASFDCIILTQTLQYIYDCDSAIKTCHRILKKGGFLLITVPGISQISHDQWGDNWLWSFTQASIKKMTGDLFTTDSLEVNSHGNVLLASSFLYGLGLPEVKQETLDINDEHYQLIITACAQK